MTATEYALFADLSFEDFKRLASDDTLSKYERIGFPDSYREGFERAIFEDLLAKLPAFRDRNRTVLDIGPGCSGLPRMIDAHCVERGHELVFVDSEEMLAHHPERAKLRKIPGRFPEGPARLDDLAGSIDAIIVYSVVQYVFTESSIHLFLDAALGLLARQGALLIGDIPNWSMRSRFFASPTGKAFHRQFAGNESAPEPSFNALQPGRIDDSVVLGLAARARAEGFHAWLVPQPDELPMANRREDLLVVRP